MVRPLALLDAPCGRFLFQIGRFPFFEAQATCRFPHGLVQKRLSGRESPNDARPLPGIPQGGGIIGHGNDQMPVGAEGGAWDIAFEFLPDRVYSNSGSAQDRVGFPIGRIPEPCAEFPGYGQDSRTVRAERCAFIGSPQFRELAPGFGAPKVC
jgi:hypothetical protein